MSDFAKRIEALSPEKRALLNLLLKEKGKSMPLPAVLSRRGGMHGPLSFAQERLWFLDQMEPGSVFYNIPLAVSLEGRLNLVALEQALGEIVRRHESLRTSFDVEESQPIQVIAAPRALPLDLAEFQAIGDADHQARGLALAREDVGRPFDLTCGPLFRATLLNFEEQKHMLVLTMHHIISDRWSFGVLAHEIATLYESYLAGEPAPLAELPVQYSDFARWQRESLQGEMLETQLDYWRQRLGGDSPMLELPADRPRPPVQTYRGAVQPLELSRSLTDGLKALGRSEGAALFITLLTALKALLYRYTGQEDVVVGSTIATRGRSELEGMIGFFVNALALRTDLSGNPSFREALHRVRETCTGAYAHQDVPFERLVDELQPGRDLSRQPFFSTLFSLQNAPMPELKLAATRLKLLPVETGTVRHDIEVWLSETATGMAGTIEYNIDLFDAGTIARLTQHLQTLLKSVVADPDQRLSELSLLSDTERHRLVAEWNDTRGELAGSKLLHRLFKEQVERTPDALAVVFEDECITYSELNRRANQLAHHLQSLGVGPESPVGVCMERSSRTLIALLAILKTGGVYLPLDPTYPATQLAFMLSDTEVTALLAEEKWLAQLPPHGATVVCMDSDRAEIARQPETEPVNHAGTENLSHIMYTSGSTGQPKGVAVPQRQLLNRFAWLWSAYPFMPGEVACQRSTANFSVSLWEMLGALLKGVPTVILSDAVVRDPVRLVQSLGAHAITRILLVPSLLRAILETDLDLERQLPGLRFLVAAGEPFSIDLYHAFCERLPQARLCIDYGATEMHGVAWHEVCEPIADRWRLPVGRPIANTGIYLLDGDLNPLPVGIPGEVHVESVGLARGYLKRADQTAERFIPSPFSAEPGARLYKTGDLARYLEDGSIEVLGRVDHQVKIRGIRIEPSEIETALIQHPSIKQAIVIADESSPHDRRLVAYLVPAQNEIIAPGQLRSFLKQRLAEHMIPSVFVTVQALPLTANGKVNRRALPAPDQIATDAVPGSSHTRAPVEGVISAIFSEILRVEHLETDDNFFDLGGHSLLATQVISRICEAFKIELALKTLFESPTVAGLAKTIEELLQAGASSAAPPLGAVDRSGELPLSFAQQRLWFLDQLEPESTAYNIPTVVRLQGRLNVSALESSLNEVARRHEALRTRFGKVKGHPVQIIAEPALQALPVVDLAGLAERDSEDQSHRLAQEESRRVFDLSTGPLVRSALVRVSGQQHSVFVTMHHIVSDGWSMGIFVRDVAELYRAYTGGEPSALPELPIQYADYAIWQREWLQADALEEQMRYWKQQLGDGLAPLELPKDNPRPPVQTYRGAAESFTLPADLTRGLKELSRREGVTLFMSLLAAFKVLLYRYSGQEQIVAGTPISNRRRVETEALIGFFVNMLVLKTDLTATQSFKELLKTIREVCLGAYAHQDVPFKKLVDELQPERDASRSPLFQVVFVLQNAPFETLEAPSLAMTPVGSEVATAKFDLTLSMIEEAGELVGTLEYSTDLFEAATIRRMIGHLETLLEAIVLNPRQCVSTLPLLTGSERHLLLAGFNGSETVWQDRRCIHRIFEDRAALTPDAIALSAGDELLTYDALNRRANQLARLLQKRGVGPEARVAICAERTAEMLISILSVLKAGGAYLPIEPMQPKERISFILEDARTPVVLTERHLLQSVSGIDQQAICLDECQDAISAEDDRDFESGATEYSLAYVIYTSGSTGRPKGVLVDHANVTRLMSATQDWFRFDENDVWTLFHSYAFDFSVWEIWGALLYGGRLVVVPYWVSRSAEAFHELLCEESVTVLNQTPSAFRQLIRADERSSDDRKLSLRLVIFGGEALELQTLKPWLDRHGDAKPRLINMYGITETTVHVTYRPIVKEDLIGRVASVVGRPIPDLQIYALNRQMELSPFGVPGEMYVGGGGVSRGYLDRPDLTAYRFIPDPFGQRPGARLYRTGDLARCLPHGDLEYLGRIDHQIKVRGFRIELGEIEVGLVSHPDVQEAIVIAREDEHGDKRIVAYIVPARESEIKIGALQVFLREKLPEYMIPSAFIVLSALPMTANGKVDRAALPAPDQARPALNSSFIAPRTPDEEVLAAIWSQVLGVEQVGIDDSFFALGGDSIRSIEIVSRARERGLSLSVQQVFQYQTIRELAGGTATQHAATGGGLHAEPFSLVKEEDRLKLPGALEDAYPLTSLQLGMLFHGEYSSESNTYHDVFSYRLKARLDLQALQSSVERLIARHPVLRTSFDLTSFGEPLQLVHEIVGADLVIEDLKRLSAGEQESALTDWIEAEKGRKFDWTRAPLLRIRVHLLSDDVFQFTISFHHAILDGWSVAWMLTELFEIHFLLAGREGSWLELPPLTRFRDYIALERNAVESEEARRYWSGKLEDANVIMISPWHCERPAADVAQVRELDVAISYETSEALKKVAHVAGVPVKSVLLAAHVRVMSLLSGKVDVLTGLALNGRPETTDGERVLGLFLNSVPLRQKLTGGTWTELVRETFDAERELLPYRRYPMARIQTDCGGQPLFNSIFGFIHFHVYERLQGLSEIELLGRVEFEQTNFDLMAIFSIDPSTSRVSLRVHCNTTALPDEQLRAIAGYYSNVLVAMASDPAARYELQSPISDRERHQMLVEWNSTQSEQPQVQAVNELFEAQVARTPDSIAAVFESGHVTYRQLNNQANRLARRLRSLGVGPEMCVGILTTRSIDALTAILAVLKAGGAYLPLDPALPKERLAFLLEDAGAPVLLTQHHLLARLPRRSAQVVLLDDGREAGDAENNCGNLIGSATPDNLAYILYTSGSTGKPKGVMIHHRGLINYLSWAAEAYELKQGRGAPVQSSIGFDLTITSMLTPLVAGRSVILLPEADGIEALSKALARDRGYSLVKITPSHLKVLKELIRSEDVAGLTNTLVIGGEALFDEDIRFWQRYAPNTRIINEYGPTETVVGCCVYEIKDETGKGAVPVGRAIQNTRMYILDERLHPVPVGVTGELYIGGLGVGRGYANRAVLTAESFIPDLYGENGGRIYRTGDLGRYRPDGTIEFLGRNDDQVKIRGYRVEPGEIESVLRRCSGVEQAVVVVTQDSQTDKRLIAYVVPERECSADITRFREYLLEHLPDYMVPSLFVMLDELPLTSNGKVDRGALPAPEPASFGQNETYVAPSNEVEETLANIWAEMLRVERVGVRDNFFELGGDSILALQALARANRAGLRFTPKQLFEKPTIAELATLARATSDPKAPKPHQGPVTGQLPLTPIQRWFFDQHHPDINHFNMAVLLDSPHDLDPDSIKLALDHLLTHHDALRMRFELVSGNWLQHNPEPGEEASLELVDLSGLSGQARAESIEMTATRMHKGLDVRRGPMMRAALMKYGGGRGSGLLMVIHHLVVDGVSWRILIEDLAKGYEQKRRGEEIRLGDKSSSYKEWAERLEEYAGSEEMKEEARYWEEAIGKEEERLPRDKEGANTVESVESVVEEMSEEETSELVREVTKEKKAEINEVLIGGLVEGVREWSGKRRVRVEMEGHGREGIIEEAEVTRTVGWFTTHYPIEVEVGEGEAGDEVIKRVKQELRSIPNHGIGFGVLRYLSSNEQIVKKLSALPKPELGFNYLGQFDQVLADSSTFSLSQQETGPAQSPRANRSHLLNINAAVIGGKLRIAINYSNAVHNRSTIEALAGSFVDALRRLIDSCRSSKGRCYTPFDFPLAALDQQTMEQLVGQNAGIEDIYPLSPLQQGFLFHSLYSSESQLYVTQFCFDLLGELNNRAFKQAWQQVVNHHATLRTAFAWRELDEPMQVLHETVTIDWDEEDWRELSPGQQQQEMDVWLEADREKGFDLSQTPLMRLALIRMGDNDYRLVCTFHHLVMDGWSGPVVLRDVFTLYEALRQNHRAQPGPKHPYRDYIAWLQQQSLTSARDFWVKNLAGFTVPTPLGLDRAPGSRGTTQKARDEQRAALPVATTEALLSIARRNHLTLNTIIQGAWAILLSHYSGKNDIVFGVTVSGRPAHLADVELIVGPFINTLPLRIQLTPDMPLLSWLKRIQQCQAEASEYEYSPLVEVQGWSQVRRGLPLFESLLVFENYRADAILPEHGSTLEISNVRASVTNNYPLTVRALPGRELSLHLLYDCHRFEGSAIERILKDFEILLTKVAQSPDQSLGFTCQAFAEANRECEAARAQAFRQSQQQKLKSIKRKDMTSLPSDDETARGAIPGASKQKIRESGLPVRRAAGISHGHLVKTESLEGVNGLPLVLAPAVEEIDLVAWAANNRDYIDAELLKHGGILLRGFNLKSAEQFEAVIKAICGNLMEYTYRSTPRQAVSGNIYTSTEYPENESIPLHNENAYTSTWPMRICFFCAQPALQGGETPLADSRKVYRQIDQKIIQRFDQKKIMYVRNYGRGLDLPWQNVFQTTLRAEVEEFCRRSRMEFEWKRNDGLRTKQVCQAVASHPRTGEVVWFNQAHLFHISSLNAEAREYLLSVFEEEDLPRNAYYGDGSQIEESILDEIREVYRDEAVVFPWQRGDMLVLDNMLAAHGRRPYTGPRRVLTGMAEASSNGNI